MRKIAQSILTCLIVLSTLTIGSFNAVESVNANASYAIGCGTNYEISWVNDSGGFNQDSCYNTFAEASNALSTKGADYVIRHHASLSPSKIIAINSGIAYSYAMRSGTKTLDVIQNVGYSANRKTTYVVNHRELAVPITRSYNGSGDGEVVVQLTGFEGFVSLKNIDLVPMKILERGLSITLGGNTSNNSEAPFPMQPVQSHYKVVQNGNYKDLVYYYYSGWSANAIAVANSSTVGPAASWMVVGETYYSHDHQNFFRDRNYSNHAGEYFSYYQYLPWRSKTKVNPATFEKYLNNLGFNAKPTSANISNLKRNESQLIGEGSTFISNQDTYGVNGLLVFSLACLESGNGRSQYAVEKNNLFGWGAVDSNPDEAWGFSSVAQGIMEQMAYNLRNYLDTNNAVFFGMHAGNKGSGFNVKYASDPYWGLKIASIAYEIDKLDNNHNGNLTDYNAYTVGIIDEYATPVYREPSTANRLFTTIYGATYQKNFTAIMLENVSNFTKIPSQNLIVNGAIVTSIKNNVRYPATAYDFESMVGYAESSKIRVISGKPLEASGDTPTGEVVQNISNFVWNGDKLSISGNAYRPGIFVTNENTLQQTISFESEYYENTSFTLNSVINNKYEATFANNDIDLSSIPVGTYRIKIQSKYSRLTDYNNEFYLPTTTALPEKKEIGNKVYEFTMSNNSVFLSVKNKVIQLPTTVRQMLNEFSYVDDHNVKINGVAFLSGLNANSDSAIKHEILLTNQETKEITAFVATTSELETPINLYDGYNYKKVAYDVLIDISKVPAGNYTIQLQVTNGDKVMKTNLNSIDVNHVPAKKEMNGNIVKIFLNQLYSYRFEISIEKTKIDESLIIKPTMRNSAFGYDSFNLDGGNLNIDGMAWIYNVNFGPDDFPNHSIVFVDEEGNVVKNKVVSKACAVDYTDILKSKFKLSNICFESSVDLKTLPNGNYRLFAEVSTIKNYDIYELTDIYLGEIPSVTIGDKIYEINISPVRSRYILTVKDK